MAISLNDVQRGYERWAAKPHNAKWVRKIDGTPIPNDIVANIFEALKDSLSDAAVKVKALEWEEIHYNRSNEEPIPELTGWYAETEVGSYYVMLEARIEVTLDGFQFHKVGSFDEPDAAFAAAQADYERRILSALVPSTPAESRCEELVKALERLRSALREIIDPISGMRARMNVADGDGLNGQMAITLSNSPEYLKEIARDALKELGKGDGR
jgi:hypothetical protein